VVAVYQPGTITWFTNYNLVHSLTLSQSSKVPQTHCLTVPTSHRPTVSQSQRPIVPLMRDHKNSDCQSMTSKVYSLEIESHTFQWPKLITVPLGNIKVKQSRHPKLIKFDALQFSYRRSAVLWYIPKGRIITILRKNVTKRQCDGDRENLQILGPTEMRRDLWVSIKLWANIGLSPVRTFYA